MSTTVAFQVNLADGLALLPTRDPEPFISCRVMVTKWTRKTEGEWVNGEPTAHNIQVWCTAAVDHYDGAVRGARVLVRGLMTTATCFARDGQQERTRRVVEVGNRFGKVEGSFKVAAARTERQRPTTSSVRLAQSDVQPAAAERAAD